MPFVCDIKRDLLRCAARICALSHTGTRIKLFGLQRQANRLLTRLIKPVPETQPLFKQARVLILLFAHLFRYRRFVAGEAAHTAQRPPDCQDPVPAGHVADAEY